MPSRSRASPEAARDLSRVRGPGGDGDTRPSLGDAPLADDASAAQYSGDPLPDDVAGPSRGCGRPRSSTPSATRRPLTRKVLGNLDPRPLRRPSAKRKVSEAEHPVRV